MSQKKMIYIVLIAIAAWWYYKNYIACKSLPGGCISPFA